MKTNRPLANVCILAALTLIAACGNKNKDDEEEATSTPTTTTKTSTPSNTSDSKSSTTSGGTTTTDTSKVEPPKAGIDPHIKAEVDQKTDGGVTGGKAVSVTGAKATLSAPSAWTVNPAKGDITTAQSADSKTWLAASPYDTGDARRDGAAAALGLTNCQWNPPDSIQVGKDKLGATAADGLCSKGTAQFHTAYFGDAAENILVLGAWDNAGGDMANVFASMRSLAKAGTGDGSGIGPCCDALRQNSHSAPLQQQGFYLAAAGVCDSLRNNPQGRAMLGQVRGALMGASMPASCK